jgi:uncharacterized caspase-like protein
MTKFPARAALQLVTVFAFGFLTVLSARALPNVEPRTALVIGNARYAFAPLSNPVHDADDIADALRGDGFEVVTETDADHRGMDGAIRSFGEKLKAKGGVGLFYFSGHGVQVDGQNYMVPIGEGITTERDLKYRAVNATQVLEEMAAANNGLNVMILDACRNNPLVAAGRSAIRGLARMEGNAGLFLSFSTSPGAVALDGDGRNSPYTKHLVEAIGSPDLSLEETFKRTLKGVHQETGGQQTPWMSSSFFGDFVFRPTTAVPSAPATPQVAARETSPRQLPTILTPARAGVYRAEGINPNGSRYHGMVAMSPLAEEVHFTWWIGKQVFQGIGRFAGRMLVVDWGQPHPVIYTFGPGRLEGEWADGSATERLEMFAEASEVPVIPPQGRYQVSGRNPSGGQYAGTASITQQANAVQVKWAIGTTSYGGVGKFERNFLTVDWGRTTPVVYATSPDGVLRGLWEGGSGEEVLSPVR